MLTNENEFFTAEEAIALNLYDTVKSGETNFSGHYTLTKGKNFEIKQQFYIFKDRVGNMHVGKFKNNQEVMKFMAYIMEREKEENAR